jgi:hypothetical protein
VRELRNDPRTFGCPAVDRVAEHVGGGLDDRPDQSMKRNPHTSPAAVLAVSVTGGRTAGSASSSDSTDQPTTSLPDLLPARDLAVRPGGIRAAFRHAKATFDEGESLWIPAMILAIGYATVIPVFLLMVALDYAAYYVAGGQ